MEKENQKKADCILKEGERLDDLQNGYWMIQKPSLFCYGIDAVLLSSYAKLKPGQNCLDLCSGSGIVPTLMAAKTQGRHFTGLEIQEESVEIGQRSILYNHLEERVTLILGDVKDVKQNFARESFDAVTCNPPYMIGQHGLTNPGEAKAIARHEILCTFEDVVRAAAYVLKPHGKFYLVHRPFRLAELFTTMKAYQLEPKRMQLVYPFIDREPNMVLLEAAKGGNSRMNIEKPLIVYKEPGTYTDEIRTLYGDGR